MPPVRNISAIGNVKPIPVYHAIPPTDNVIVKVTVDTTSEEIDVSDLITSANFTGLGVVDSIATFELNFLDPAKEEFEKIVLYDDVYIYADYGAEATTKRFRFKIENINYKDSTTILSGKGIGMILSEKSIVYQSVDSDGNLTSKAKSTILQEILEQNFPDITDFSEIETNTESIEKSYFEIKFLDIINELCGETHFFYLDKDLIPHYFTKGSVTNTTEAIIDKNLVYVNDNSENSEDTFSRVRVYGQSEDGIPIIHTSSNNTTYTGGINKDYIINNTSVTTTTQASSLTSSESSKLNSSKNIKEITSWLLPTLNFGEALFIGVDEQNISPGHYNVKEFSINIDNNGDVPFTTTLVIEQRRNNVSKIIRNTISSQTKQAENNNPNDMDYSYILTFKEDSGTHDDTQVSENYLKVAPGKSTGQWVSDLIELTDDISAIEFRWSGDLLVGDYLVTSSNIWFSLDGGSTWRINPPKGSTTTVPTGRDLKVRVDLNSSDARVKRIGIYYKF